LGFDPTDKCAAPCKLVAKVNSYGRYECKVSAASAFASSEETFVDEVNQAEKKLKTYVVTVADDIKHFEGAIAELFGRERDFIKTEENKFVIELSEAEAKVIEAFKIGTAHLIPMN